MSFVDLRRVLSLALLVGFFFAPAAILLFFAWSVWTGTKRPHVAAWRLRLYRAALICATLTMLLLAPASAYYLDTLRVASGARAAMNHVGALLWFFCFAAAFSVRGRPRLLLSGWAVALLLAEFVVYLQMP